MAHEGNELAYENIFYNSFSAIKNTKANYQNQPSSNSEYIYIKKHIQGIPGS